MRIFDDLVTDKRTQCPHCKSKNIEKRVLVGNYDGTYKQMTICKDCKKTWWIVYESSNKSKIIDIEHTNESGWPYDFYDYI